MAKKIYVGDGSSLARIGAKMYVGIDNIARKATKGYIGDENGIARLFFDLGGSAGGGVPWLKYNFTIETTQVPYVSYTEKNSPTAGGTANTVSGYEGYRLDSTDGTFTLTGSHITLTSGVDNGTVYTGGGSSVTALTPLAGGGYSASVITAVKQTDYTNETTYTLGSLVGTVYAEEGAYPDAAENYTYVMDYTENGVTYTIMKNGNTYYAYAPQ